MPATDPIDEQFRAGFPLHRFEEFGPLEAEEAQALASLGLPPVRHRRHDRLREQGEPVTGFYLLAEGWTAAAQTLRSGGRQILKVHLPGDALGTPSMCMAVAAEELFCLTDATVIEVPLERFWRVFEAHPRFGARFLLSVQRERIALMDRLASKGRTFGPAQLAAFLLDLAERLTPLGLVSKGTFEMMLTQEQIGDLLGMTGVHVNRMMRVLKELELVKAWGRNVTILDHAGLARLADRPSRELATDDTLLPGKRPAEHLA